MAQQLLQALSQSFSPDVTVRRQAERAIEGLQGQPGFGQLALGIAQDGGTSDPIRLGSVVAFKNWVRSSWATDEAAHPITEADRQQLKSAVVPVMVALAAKPSLQIQVGEAISLMAEVDFPAHWNGLVEQLVSSLSSTDFVVNNAILKTAHSIFGRWRHLFRSDDLFREIKFVLERFAPPFMQLFQRTDELLGAATAMPAPASPDTLLETLLLLVQIFYDLNSQDLPEYFEDNITVFMPLLHKHLTATYPTSPAPTAEDDDDADETLRERVKAAICEAIELYATKYTEEFTELDRFVETVWTVLQSLGSSRRYDALVNRAISFLSVVVRMPGKAALFGSEATLQSLCQHIVLPNMSLRDFEVELFEDDPSEFVRRDIEGSAESGTRRHAASDFVRALLEQFEQGVTGIMQKYIGSYLQQYNADRTAHWKSKDTAVFLLTSVASRGVSTAASGVTSTNSLIDLVSFFAEHVMPDLRTSASGIHPIIRADAIKFLYTFRSQLTKDQLVAVLPLLIPHLRDSSQVIHTYAAMTIERILFVKHGGRSLFTPTDVQPHAQDIISAALLIIESGTTPQEIAHNDQLMKCIMRVIICTRAALAGMYAPVLEHLVKIMVEVSKNPSNPKFNHFLFESVSALVRYVGAARPDALAAIENQLFPPFQYILANDVSEFAPFAFQILSQLVELHRAATPESYKALIPGLLMAPLWTSRGNVPALVRLVRAFLAKGVFEPAQLAPLRDVLRYLAPQKAHDASTFDLAEALVQYGPIEGLKPIMTDILLLMLTRLTSAKTASFSQGFLRFLCLLIALQRPNLGADDIIALFDRIQPGLFGQMLPSLLPDTQSAPARNRKIVAVGLTRLLTESTAMVAAPNASHWPATMVALLKLTTQPQEVRKTDLANDVDADEVVVNDLEAVGYQASFSKLGASEGPQADPLPDVGDVQALLARNLSAASQARPGVYASLLAAVDAQYRSAFEAYMRTNGQHVA